MSELAKQIIGETAYTHEKLLHRALTHVANLINQKHLQPGAKIKAIHDYLGKIRREQAGKVKESEGDGEVRDLARLATRFSAFDALEIHPCCDVGEGQMEQCGRSNSRISCWSVYGHLRGRGLECIADFDTEQEAISEAEKISAQANIPVYCLDDDD